MEENMQTDVICLNLGFVNAYLLSAGDGFILVDTGMPGSRAVLEKELEKAGCTPGKLRLVILTHGDIDHSGNCAYIMSKYGVKSAMNKNDAFMVENGDMLSVKRKVKSFFMRLVHLFLAGSKRFKKMIDSFERFKPDILLEDGQSMSQYGADAKVIFIPGHTGGSIGILTGRGDFISGDMLNNSRKPATAVIIQDEMALEHSVIKIKGLGIKTVYSGHGSPFQAGLIFK
jgi:glyoxylase-like metal-dependent hydrolase (beta-lactamase superfamily II)